MIHHDTETLLFAPKLSDPRFPSPSTMSDWIGLRGLVHLLHQVHQTLDHLRVRAQHWLRFSQPRFLLPKSRCTEGRAKRIISNYQKNIWTPLKGAERVLLLLQVSELYRPYSQYQQNQKTVHAPTSTGSTGKAGAQATTKEKPQKPASETLFRHQNCG